VRSGLGHIKRLVIYLNNGPKNSGRRTQFSETGWWQLADGTAVLWRSGWCTSTVPQQIQSDRAVLVVVAKEMNGVLLNCLKVILQCALRITWKKQHPTVKRLHAQYPDGVTCSRQGDEIVRGTTATFGNPAEVYITIKPRTTERAGIVVPWPLALTDQVRGFILRFPLVRHLDQLTIPPFPALDWPQALRWGRAMRPSSRWSDCSVNFLLRNR